MNAFRKIDNGGNIIGTVPFNAVRAVFHHGQSLNIIYGCGEQDSMWCDESLDQLEAYYKFLGKEQTLRECPTL